MADSQLPRRASEDVIINSPMSFAGAAQRAFRMKRGLFGAHPKWYAQIPGVVGVLLVIAVWWVLVVLWYLVFGLLLVPYRLLRRGARKRKKEALRHREVMDALERKHDPPAA